MGELTADSNVLGRYRIHDETTFESVHVIAPVVLFDDFIGKALDSTNDWNVTVVNSGTAAVVASGTGGVCRITTGAADDDDVEVASALVFKASKRPVIEFRVAMNDVVGSAMCIGLSDAVSEGVDTLAMTIDAGELVSTATDGVFFLWDPDETGAFIRCAAVKNDVDSAVTTTALAMVNATYRIFRIELDADGTAYFYVDGALVATIATALTTTVALCAYVGLINREAAANTLDVDYVRVWQDR